MISRKWLIILTPLAIGSLALLLLLLLLLYLFVFGSMLGHNVSSLDSGGPQWPFAAAWSLGWIAMVSIPLGVAWAVMWLFLLKR